MCAGGREGSGERETQGGREGGREGGRARSHPLGGQGGQGSSCGFGRFGRSIGNSHSLFVSLALLFEGERNIYQVESSW